MNIDKLDRYRKGIQKSDPHPSEDEARRKAAALFYERGDEYMQWYPEDWVGGSVTGFDEFPEDK